MMFSTAIVNYRRALYDLWSIEREKRALMDREAEAKKQASESLVVLKAAMTPDAFEEMLAQEKKAMGPE